MLLETYIVPIAIFVLFMVLFAAGGWAAVIGAIVGGLFTMGILAALLLSGR